MTGSDVERELWHWFMDNNYSALRAPGSGGRTDRESPDLVALRLHKDVYVPEMDKPETCSKAHAIEVKKRPSGTVTLEKDEIHQLRLWSDRAGSTAWVVVKPDLRTFDSWFCLEVDNLHTIKSGNFSIRKQDHSKCKTLQDAFL